MLKFKLFVWDIFVIWKAVVLVSETHVIYVIFQVL